MTPRIALPSFQQAIPVDPASATGPRSKRQLSVVCLTDDPEVSAVVVAGAARLTARPVVTRSPAGFTERALGGLDGSIVFADLEGADTLSFEAGERLRAVAAVADLVIVLPGAAAVDGARLALRLGAVDILAKPLTEDAVVRSLEEAAQRLGAVSAHCTAIVSASGGAGGTTVATTLADHLANGPGASDSVCLVDLDYVSGACGLHLDAPGKLDLSEALGDLDRIDAEYLDLVTGRVDALRVLSVRAPMTASASELTRFSVVALDVLERAYDHLVVDLPYWAPQRDLALTLAMNRVFVVAAPTVPSLKLARAKLDALRAIGVADGVVHLLVNQYRTSWFSNRIDRSMLDKMLADIPHSFIRADDDTVVEAQNCGVPPRTVNRRSPMVRDVIAAFEKARRRGATAKSNEAARR